MTIKILALRLKHSKCQPYKTRNGTTQFMVRLYCNNLFLNKNADKWKKRESDKCWACDKCRETRFHLFGRCEKTMNIFQFLCSVDWRLITEVTWAFFSLRTTEVTIEKVSLMFLWNFMYVNKFNGGYPNCKNIYISLLGADGSSGWNGPCPIVWCTAHEILKVLMNSSLNLRL